MPPVLEAALAQLDKRPVDAGTELEREHARAAGVTLLGQVQMSQGKIKDAITTLKSAVALARAVDDPRLLVQALGNLGTMLTLGGDFAVAGGVINESIEVARSAGINLGLVFSLGIRATARANFGHDYAGARADLEEALRIAAEFGDRSGMGMTKTSLAYVDMLEGRYAEAVTLLEEALKLFDAGQEGIFGNRALSALADAHRLTGDYAQATMLYRKTIQKHQLAGNRGGIARCLECLAFMQVQQAEANGDAGRIEYATRAARLFGAAEAVREASGMQMGLGEPEEYARYMSPNCGH